MTDPIDRQEAINAFKTATSDGDKAEWCEWVLKQLPTAQPERKMGQWINKPNIYGVAYCSECDFELHINNTPYCPMCGACMIEEKEVE